MQQVIWPLAAVFIVAALVFAWAVATGAGGWAAGSFIFMVVVGAFFFLATRQK